MTVALGFRCMDGFVLCADSLESDGFTQRFVDKMWIYEVQGEWGIAIASAGEADLADSFNESLEKVLGNSDFDETRLLAKLRKAVRAVRVSYPEATFDFLAVIFGRPSLYSKLYRVLGGSHLGPVKKYQAIGAGAHLSAFLASQLYRDSMCVSEGVRLATFITARVKEHVDGCGGPTSVISYGGIGDDSSAFRLWGRKDIENIEVELSDVKLRNALDLFWTNNNPIPTFSPVRSKNGGSTRWVRTAKLNTIP